MPKSMAMTNSGHEILSDITAHQEKPKQKKLVGGIQKAEMYWGIGKRHLQTGKKLPRPDCPALAFLRVSLLRNKGAEVLTDLFSQIPLKQAVVEPGYKDLCRVMANKRLASPPNNHHGNRLGS
jgi:hypothetical protein